MVIASQPERGREVLFADIPSSRKGTRPAVTVRFFALTSDVNTTLPLQASEYCFSSTPGTCESLRDEDDVSRHRFCLSTAYALFSSLFPTLQRGTLGPTLTLPLLRVDL
jgi:hypothetical protein